MSHHPERTARNVRPVNQPPSKLYAGDKGKYVKEAVKLKDGYLRKCFDHLLEREICEFQPDIILTLGNEVVDVRYTSSILSKAHLPKDGYEVQCIPENGRYINLTGWLIDGHNHDSGTRCCGFSGFR